MAGEAGNNTYKAVQQATRCVAISPIMQGLRMPVNDLSHGCTVNDIVNTVVITCIQVSSFVSPDRPPFALDVPSELPTSSHLCTEAAVDLQAIAAKKSANSLSK